MMAATSTSNFDGRRFRFIVGDSDLRNVDFAGMEARLCAQAIQGHLKITGHERLAFFHLLASGPGVTVAQLGEYLRMVAKEMR